MRTFALLPAAGKSARMGRPKLALPLGGRTVLERVLDTLRVAHIDAVLVVLGPHGNDLKAVAERAGAHVLLLADETPDMRATIQHGLAWLDSTFAPRDDDAFLLLPADHPTLSPDVIAQLLAARAASPAGTNIWIPTHAGRRGHPALIGWRHMPAIRALPADQGLNAYLRSRAAETAEIAWPSAEVLCDLDTPADYERVQRQFVAGAGPTA